MHPTPTQFRPLLLLAIVAFLKAVSSKTISVHTAGLARLDPNDSSLNLTALFLNPPSVFRDHEEDYVAPCSDLPNVSRTKVHYPDVIDITTGWEDTEDVNTTTSSPKSNATFYRSSRPSHNSTHLYPRSPQLTVPHISPFPHLHYPYSSIGRLVYSTGHYCTAFMIGMQHALTSRHCVYVNDIKIPESGKFVPADPSLPSAWVRWIWQPRDPDKICAMRDDWIVLVLSEFLGHKTGYFGIKTLDAPGLFISPTGVGKTLEVGGYPYHRDKGTKGWREEGVQVTGNGDCFGLDYKNGRKWVEPGKGPLRLDTPGGGGMFGAPAWEMDERGAWAVGMLSASAEGRSWFTTGPGWVNALRIIRGKYDWEL
ncbi:hypothetical protein OQA88_10531 [Cercophora sp. LCS_1]